MFDLDRAISEWRQRMAAGGIKASEVLDELESHLRDDVGQQVRSGLSDREAFEAAAECIGEATVLEAEFGKVGEARRLRGRKRLLGVLGTGVGLLIASAIACDLLILPLALRANAHYASWLGNHGLQANLGASLGFICRFVLGTGLALAMPVGLLTLVSIGILSHRKLESLRRYLVVVNLILGAMLTTPGVLAQIVMFMFRIKGAQSLEHLAPEVATQIVMFIALQLLCEVSILIAWVWECKGRKPG